MPVVSISAQQPPESNAVIALDAIQIDRRQFEQEFELAMVLKAVETGVPVKNQDQISVMEQRFIDQRARELVLLKEAGRRGIEVSAGEIERELDGYLKRLGFPDGNTPANLSRLGLPDAGQLREYIRVRTLTGKMVGILKQETGSDDVMSLIDRLYKESGVVINRAALHSVYRESTAQP